LNKDNTKIFTANGNIVVEGDVASIEIYNILGGLVQKNRVNSTRTEIPIYKSGIYLVRTVSRNKNVFTSKVIIN
jgi:hypothetical protein